VRGKTVRDQRREFPRSRLGRLGRLAASPKRATARSFRPRLRSGCAVLLKSANTRRKHGQVGLIRLRPDYAEQHVPPRSPAVVEDLGVGFERSARVDGHFRRPRRGALDLSPTAHGRASPDRTHGRSRSRARAPETPLVNPDAKCRYSTKQTPWLRGKRRSRIARGAPGCQGQSCSPRSLRSPRTSGHGHRPRSSRDAGGRRHLDVVGLRSECVRDREHDLGIAH